MISPAPIIMRQFNGSLNKKRAAKGTTTYINATKGMAVGSGTRLSTLSHVSTENA